MLIPIYRNFSIQFLIKNWTVRLPGSVVPCRLHHGAPEENVSVAILVANVAFVRRVGAHERSDLFEVPDNRSHVAS